MNNYTNENGLRLTSPSVIHDILGRHKLHFNKQFGQNFLIDSNIVSKIVSAAEITPDDIVLEVGPGIGTMTMALAEQAAKVISVEIDKKLIPVLEETLAGRDNIEILSADILKTDIGALLAPYAEQGIPVKIAANLPYYITTPVIMNFLECDIPFEHMTFLVQKEVGERMSAEPGCKAYGALSIAAQYYADIKTDFLVPSDVFMPKPKVDSVVISLTPKKTEGLVYDVDKHDFLKLVKAAFGNRRKTLINSLSMNTGYTKDTLLQMLESCGIDPGVRAEKLTAMDFAAMTRALENISAAS